VPEEGESLGDPAIDILAAYFSAVLTAWLGDAWIAVAPGEPVVRTVYKHDPEEIDFRSNDLPLLCLWREGDTSPKNLADGYQEMESTLNVLWVPPPAPQTKSSRRHSFLSAFSKAIALAVKHERDPSYVRASDPSSAEAAYFGSDVQALADIDWWRLQRVTRVPVDVGDGSRSYPAYLATLLIGETTETDPAAWNEAEPTVIDANMTTGGDSPLTTQRILLPPDADEP
jgi:hypothetical protein